MKWQQNGGMLVEDPPPLPNGMSHPKWRRVACVGILLEEGILCLSSKNRKRKG
jgi:hypothetical protein